MRRLAFVIGLVVALLGSVAHASGPIRPTGLAGWAHKQKVGWTYVSRRRDTLVHAAKRAGGRVGLFALDIGVGAGIGAGLTALGVPPIPAALISGGAPTPLMHAAQRALAARKPAYFVAPDPMTKKQLAVETAISAVAGLAGGVAVSKLESVLPRWGQEVSGSALRVGLRDAGKRGLRTATRAAAKASVRAARYLAVQIAGDRASSKMSDAAHLVLEPREAN